MKTSPRDYNPAEEAKRLRKQAIGTPPGIERERLIRRARQAEVAAKLDERANLPGLIPANDS
jgi:hypothetical protein